MCQKLTYIFTAFCFMASCASVDLIQIDSGEITGNSKIVDFINNVAVKEIEEYVKYNESISHSDVYAIIFAYGTHNNILYTTHLTLGKTKCKIIGGSDISGKIEDIVLIIVNMPEKLSMVYGYSHINDKWILKDKLPLVTKIEKQ